MRHSAVQSRKAESAGNIAWRSLALAYRTARAHINSDLRRYGLTSPQYDVLRSLGSAEAQSLPMNEIGKALAVTFANITIIVDNLEKRSYVKRTRSGRDRRVVTVELTAVGLSLFERIRTAHRNEISKLMGSLSRSELENLTEYTTKIRESVPAKSERSSKPTLSSNTSKTSER